MEKTTRFFTERELACKCGCGLGMKDMDQGFLNRLDMVRTMFGEPLILTSAMRCNNYNMKIKGAPKSQHLVGKAVDIACVEPDKRHRLVTIATSLGMSCGLDGAFVHVDSRDTTKMLWLYPVGDTK